MEKSGMDEIIVEEGDKKITLRKHPEPAPSLVHAPSSVMSPAPSSSPLAKKDVSLPQGDSVAPIDTDASSVDGSRANWKSVDAPMVGIFYTAPSPEAENYVKVGQSVGVGDILCIVEAMKLMNEVSAQEAGIIREVCAQNGDLVEYGAALFYYEVI
jgi:acetyl-CoA carboxylase biotin carboxyl carrier protein